eukprot:1820839-Alexandrium_andersonii.AAC.1
MREHILVVLSPRVHVRLCARLVFRDPAGEYANVQSGHVAVCAWRAPLFTSCVLEHVEVVHFQ